MVMGMDTGTVMGRMNARLKRLLTAGSVFVGLLAGLEPAHVLAQQQQPMTGRPAGQLEGGAATRLTDPDLQPTGPRQPMLRLGLLSSLSWSDNVDAESESPIEDWVLEVTPTLGLRREHGRLTGFLDARLRTQHYLHDDARNTRYAVMNGSGALEAVKDAFFVDFDGRITRENRSLLDGRGPGDGLSNRKEDETRDFSVGPRLQLRPFDLADARLAYREIWQTGGGDFEQRRIGRVDVELIDEQPGGRVDWAMVFFREHARYDDDARPDVLQQRWLGLLGYRPLEMLRLYGGGGVEWNEFDLGERQRDDILMVGGEWLPSPRTRLHAQVLERFFGTGYDFELTHRRPRSAWTLSARRDVSSALDDRPGVREGQLYQQYYASLGHLSDPAQRELEARRRVEEDMSAQAGRFASNNYFVEQAWRAALVMNGRRDTLTLGYRYSERTRLGAPVERDGRDDFREYERIDDQALSLGLSHRLTPLSSSNLVVVRSRAEGRGQRSERTDRWLVSMGLNSRLGEHATGSLIYRYSQADSIGDASDYTENSVTASLGIRF